MFRIITAFVEQPMFMLVCDNQQCCGIGNGPFSPELLNDQKAMDKAQYSFIEAAQKDGWVIGIGAQLCPNHVKAARAAAEARKERGQQVVAATSIEDALKFRAAVGNGNGKGLAIVRP